MILASPTAILEPQITLHSIEGDNVILHASPKWKKKLVAFLKYAQSTDDVTVDCHVPLDALSDVQSSISKQSHTSDTLKINKLEFLNLCSAVAAFSDFPSCIFYDYNHDDFNRLHDDILEIESTVFKRQSRFPRRIKTGLLGEFDG
tara:strand:- start:14861 stop:15298 length:438 start_codon:yes stop_codon:yes gene_type:complete